LSEEQFAKAESYINQFISKVSSASINRVIEFRMSYDRMYRAGVGGAWKKIDEKGLRQMQEHEPISGLIDDISYKNRVMKVCCRLTGKIRLIKFKVGDSKQFSSQFELASYDTEYSIGLEDNYFNDGKDEYDIKNSEFHFINVEKFKSDNTDNPNLSLFDDID